MGYLTVIPDMEAKRAFCPGSTGKLTNQLLVKDHMVSHYKKIYSAKAAVDCSVPKSMRCSIKYNDQKQRERMTKAISGAQSLGNFRLNNTPSHSSKNARPVACGEENALLCSGSSAMSSPRFNTSFPSKQIVYPSQMAASSLNCQPASELTYRMSQRHPLTRSYTHSLSSSQGKFKSFQDPTQKTYSGDLLLKHADHFTEEKPFTPRTLKSDHKSALSSYRYYTPSRRKGAEEKIPSKSNRQDTDYERAQSQCRSPAGKDSSQPYSITHECSDDEANVFGHYSTSNKYRDYEFFLSSSRVSPEGMKSPTMRKVTAEEEELMYLEFITDVTNEIIERGIYSDRVLKRVFERHIDMNKHRLNKDKMHRLLNALQDDLQSPPAAAVSVLEKTERDSSFLHRHMYSGLEQEMKLVSKDEVKFLSFTQIDKDTEERGGLTHSPDPTAVNSSVSECVKPERNKDEQDFIDLGLDYKEKNEVPSSSDNHQLYEEEKPLNSTDNDELVKQVDELGVNMKESLNISENYSSQEEQDTSIKLSDDEF